MSIVTLETAFEIPHYEGDFVGERQKGEDGTCLLHKHPPQERGASEDEHRAAV